MLPELLNDALEEIKTMNEFSDDPENKVFRGELGKINVVKDIGCIGMPEFNPPKMFGDQDDNEKDKLLKYTPNFFVIAAYRKTLVQCEDDCMDLAFKVIQKLNKKIFNVDMGGQKTFQPLEWTDIEWTERSASLCIIA